ncbi:hypothetical protein BH18ACT1_BH18ACT1_17770 [soil metagenome]
MAGAVEAGVVEELPLHLAPIALGAGTPLFRGGLRQALVALSVRSSRHATHLRYEVTRG